MPAPIVTLTTDFGLSDHYVGVMKGVILGICPEARVVDVTHAVTPHAIAEGAYLIAQAYRWFPKKTVHVVVVDPGVGSARRPLLAEAAGQFFVAPDNGVLSMIYAQEKHAARVIRNTRYFLRPVSQTFHGRDIFSPVAAHLAGGVPAARMGERISDHVRADFGAARLMGERTWSGHILHVDRFGNIVTNFRTGTFQGLATGKFSLTLGRRRIGALAHSYAERNPGELFAIEGSGGFLEVSVREGSAAELTGCRVGDAVTLRLK